MITRELNIGAHRRGDKVNPRVWIEAGGLTEAGWIAGAAYQQTVSTEAPQAVILKRGNADKSSRVKKVAGTPARPILDLSGAYWRKLGLDVGDRVQVTITADTIRIERESK